MAIIETFPGAYKGVEFLMLTANTSGGIKDMLFEYPNSPKQHIEQFDTKARTYALTIVIPHDGYFLKRDSLLSVLEEGGAGPLDHPTMGKIEDIVVRTFSLTERITELGRAEIQITFAVSDDIGTPQQAENSISEVALENDELTEVVVFDTTEVFIVDTGFAGNFQDAQELLSDVGDAFDTAVSAVTAITDEINAFSAQLNTFVDDINTLIALPQDLANSIKGIFSTINGVVATFESAVLMYSSFFDFGDNDTAIMQTTAGLTQRAGNRDVINQFMRTSALGYAYLNAAQITFQTTDDIDRTNAALEAQYLRVTTDIDVSEETKRAITDVRTIANTLFDAARLDAKKVITVYTHLRPMSEIAYQYYGSTALTDTLLELNGIDNSAFVQGDIKILTE